MSNLVAGLDIIKLTLSSMQIFLVFGGLDVSLDPLISLNGRRGHDKPREYL